MAFDPFWGQQLPVGVSGSPYPALPQQPTPQIPQVPQQGGGMFGNGKFGIGQAIVAALNGYLASTRGPSQELGAQNLQMMAAMRQRQMEHQQSLDDYNRKRADDNADWRTQYDYELAHPKEGTGSEYERLLAAAGITPGTPHYQEHVNAKIGEMEDPVVMTPYGPMVRSQALKMGGGQPAPPGVTFTPLPSNGGPAPGAPGGFPY